MASNNLIYIVDDQPDYRFVLQQLFHHYFPAYSIRIFDSGQALLDELSDFKPKPGLILLDRHMPDLDGHQTLRSLKGNPAYKRTPVAMMSDEASDVEINKCYEAGVNTFIKKQLDFQSMAATIKIVCQYWLEINTQPIED